MLDFLGISRVVAAAATLGARTSQHSASVMVARGASPVTSAAQIMEPGALCWSPRASITASTPRMSSSSRTSAVMTLTSLWGRKLLLKAVMVSILSQFSCKH